MAYLRRPPGIQFVSLIQREGAFGYCPFPGFWGSPETVPPCLRPLSEAFRHGLWRVVLFCCGLIITPLSRAVNTQFSINFYRISINPAENDKYLSRYDMWFSKVCWNRTKSGAVFGKTLWSLTNRLALNRIYYDRPDDENYIHYPTVIPTYSIGNRDLHIVNGDYLIRYGRYRYGGYRYVTYRLVRRE